MRVAASGCCYTRGHCKCTLLTLAFLLGGIVGTPMDVCNVRMQDDGRLPAEQRRNYR